jgi:hypothetical protein
MLWIFLPDSNPWSWVPEASMLTTRPPKPLRLHVPYFCIMVWRNYLRKAFTSLHAECHVASEPPYVCGTKIWNSAVLLSTCGKTFFVFVFFFCVGPAVTHRMYCSLPRLIVLTPLFLVSPFHLQARCTSDDARELYQRKVELWARNVRSI